MLKIPQGGTKHFLFRDIPQNVLIGTASDRYAGWIGQDSKRRMGHSAKNTPISIVRG